MGKLNICAMCAWLFIAVGCSYQQEIQSLERMIGDLRTQNDHQSEEIIHLKQSLGDTREKLNNLERTVDGAKIREIEAYRKQAQADSNYIDQKKNQSENTYQEILQIQAKSQEAYNQLQNEFLAVIHEAKRTHEENKRLLDELKKDRYVTELLTKIEWFKKNLDTAVRVAEQAKLDADSASESALIARNNSEKAVEYAERINAFSGMIAQLSQQIGALQSDVVYLKNELTHVHENLHGLAEFVQRTNAHLARVEHRLEHLQREVDRLERRIGTQDEEDHHDDRGPSKK